MHMEARHRFYWVPSSLFSETEAYIEPRAHPFGPTGWPARLINPALASLALELQACVSTLNILHS